MAAKLIKTAPSSNSPEMIGICDCPKGKGAVRHHIYKQQFFQFNIESITNKKQRLHQLQALHLTSPLGDRGGRTSVLPLCGIEGAVLSSKSAASSSFSPERIGICDCPKGKERYCISFPNIKSSNSSSNQYPTKNKDFTHYSVCILLPPLGDRGGHILVLPFVSTEGTNLVPSVISKHSYIKNSFESAESQAPP
jgi:hypothetical protein